MFLAAVLAAFLAVGARAVPTGSRRSETCSTSCPAASHFDYRPGSTYVYSYSADVATTIAGSTDEASRLHAAATAHISVISPCDLRLTLMDVTLKDSLPEDASSQQDVENMASFKQELERRSLTFSFQGGQVEHLCPYEEEPVWVLNFKRGVLSTLVSGLGSLTSGSFVKTETDVSGECTTEYNVEEFSSGVLVTKTKDLLSCKQRGHLISSLQTTPYQSTSKVQSLPLLASTLKCEQKVTDKRVRSVTCEERHLFRPLSREESGAVTVTNVKLTELAVRTGVVVDDQSGHQARQSPIFDTTDPEVTQRNNLDAVLSLIGELDEKTSAEVRPEAPRLFTRLVMSLRHMDYTGIEQVASSLSSQTQRKYFIDALPMVGTAASMSLMRYMIINDEIGSAESDRWMTALAFVHEPTLEMVEALVPLIVNQNARKQTLLGVSSLIHQYCQRRPSCISDEPIQQAIQSLEQYLSGGCYARSEEEVSRVMTALKSIGNIGRILGATNELRRCVESTENTVEMRLAAVNAFHRMPCSDARLSILMASFSDQKVNTEVRIAAYLGIMKCPSHQTIDKIHEVLARESVNQVGSFVWTHLTNMQETNDPVKQYVKSLLKNADLEKKFKTDVRKFSRYFEKSVFFDSVNAGASVESAVVFSANSFVPRSGMLNLTLDLFGEAINLFEVGGRVEGLDSFVENIFGSNGMYPQQAIHNMLKPVSDTNEIAPATPRASSYLKIFGNELKFNRFDNIKELMDSMKSKGPLDFLQKLAKEADWTENINFLDSTYIVPTIAGMPFSLRVIGSASVSLKTGGSFGIESWKKMNIDGYIKPSAAVEIITEMGVDAHVAHTGIKMNTNLHTSTVVDGKVLVDEGKVVSVRINMPKDKIEMFDVTTRFHSAHRNKMRVLAMGGDDRSETRICSGYITERLLGLNFCTNLEYPLPSQNKPELLLAGPISAQMFVEKVDNIQAFNFEYSHSYEDRICKSTLMIDTPGSSVDRRINVNVMFNANKNALQISLYTPIKSFDVSGLIELDDSVKLFDAQLSVDQQEMFAIVTKLVNEDSDDTWRFAPSLVIRGESGEVFNLQGAVSTDKRNLKYDAEFALSKVFESPITFKAAAYEEDGAYNVVQSFSSYIITGVQTGTFKIADDHLLIDTNTEYNFFNGNIETAGISAQLGYEAEGDQYTYRATLGTYSTALPVLDAEFKYIHNGDLTSCHNKLTLLHNQKDYTLTTHFNTRDDKNVVATSIGFIAQHWDMDIKVAGEFDLGTSGVGKFSGETRLNEHWKAATNILVRNKRSADGFHYGGSVELMLPQATYAFEIGARRENTAGHVKFVVSRDVMGDREVVSLVALLTMEEKDKSVELTLFVPKLPKMQMLTKLVSGEGGVYLAEVGATYGELSYTAGAEYKFTDHHLVKLVAEYPGHKMIAVGTAQMDGMEHRYTVDVRNGRRVLATILAKPFGNTVTGDFELFWNKDADDTEVIRFNVVGKRASKEISAILKYPGHRSKLTGQMRMNGLVADLEYGRGKTIHLESTARVSGLFNAEFIGKLTTPIAQYRTISVSFYSGPGQLGPGADSEFKLTGEWNRVKSELRGRVVSGGSSSDRHSAQVVVDFTSPLVGWEKAHFDTTVFAEGAVYSVRAAASLNEHSAGLGVLHEFSNVNGVFKLSSGMDIKLPIQDLKSAKLSLDFKMDQMRVDGGAAAIWETDTTNELSVSLTSNNDIPYSDNHESNLVINTPFDGHRQYSGHFLLRNHADDFTYLLRVKKSESVDLFLAELNALLSNPSDIVFNGRLNSYIYPGVGFDFKHTEEIPASKFSFTANKGDKSVSLTGTWISPSPSKEQVELTLVMPCTRTYKLKHSYELDMQASKFSEYTELSRDNDVASLEFNGKWTKELDEHTGQLKWLKVHATGALTTTIAGWESVKVTQDGIISIGEQMEYSNRIEFSITDKHIEVVDKVIARNSLDWQYERQLSSNTQMFSSVNIAMNLKAQTLKDVKFNAKLNIDGVEKDIYYSHELTGQENDEKALISAKIRPNGDFVYTLDLDATLLSDQISPMSIVISCPCGKTVIFGSVMTDLNTPGESRISIESPFTDKIVISEYSNPRSVLDYSLDVTHGTQQYSMSAKGSGSLDRNSNIDISFNSPEHIIGSGSFKLRYDINTEFKADTQLSLNDWKSSANVRLSRNEGELKAQVPAEGYRLLTAAFKFVDETLEVRLTREKRQALLVVSCERDAHGVDINLRITTPFRDYETIIINAHKYNDQNKYSLNYVRGRHASASITASADQGMYELKAEALAAYSGHSELNFNLNLIEQHVNLKVVNDGHETMLEGNLDHKDRDLTAKLNYFNSLFYGPKKLGLTCKYHVDMSQAMASMTLVKDQDTYVGVSEYSISNTLHKVKKAKIELSKNEASILVSAKYVSSDKFYKFKGRLETPLTNLRQIKVEQEINWESYPAFVNMVFQKNEDISIIKAEMIKDTHYFQLKVETPCPKLKYISLESTLQDVDGKDTVTTILTHNEDKMTMVMKKRLTMINSEVSLDLDTPYKVFSHAGFLFRYDLSKDSKNIFVSLVNNDERVQINADCKLGYTTARTKISIETPFKDWRTVSYNVMYDLAADEKIMEVSYERNGVKSVLASRGSYNDEGAYIDMLTPFEGYERLGVNGRYVNRRGKREASYDANVNDHRHRVYILYERSGIDSAKLRLETPIEGMRLIEVDVSSKELSDGREMHISTNRDGKKSSAEIKLTGSNGVMDVSVEAHTYIAGLEHFKMTGTANYGAAKKSFSLSSLHAGNSLEIAGDLEASKQNGNGHFKAKLPVDGLRNVDISFDYNLGDEKTIKLVSMREGVTREFSGKLTYDDSSFTVDLATPYEGFQKIHASAKRDENADGKIEAEISLKRGDSAITVKYDYVFTSSLGEGNIVLTTPYDGFQNMEFHGMFEIEDKSRSMTMNIKRNDRTWDISTERTWENDIDKISITVASPVDVIKSVKIKSELDFSKTRELGYEGSYELNDKKVEVTGKGVISETGEKAMFDMNVKTPLQVKELKATADYDFTGETKAINAHVSADDRYADLKAKVSASKGTVNVETTNAHFPKLDFEYTATVANNLRDITAKAATSDETYTIDYKADYTKPMEGGGSFKYHCTKHGNHLLTWSYTTPDDDYTGMVKYDSDDVKVDISGSVEGERYKQRKIIFKSSVISDQYTSTRTATFRYNIDKGLSMSTNINSNGKTIDGKFDVKTVGDKSVMTLSYNGLMLKDMKVQGEWTIPRTLEGQKDFKFAMTHEGSETTLNGFVKLGTTMKSGSMEVSLKTPLEPLTSVKIGSTWNFIRPNVLLNFDYTRNDKHFVFNFSGTRNPGAGDFTLQINLPHDEVIHEKNINQIAIKTSFDVSDGIMFKLVVQKPLEFNFNFDHKLTDTTKKLDISYDFTDSPQDLIPWVDKCSSELHITRTERSQGPKIEITAGTSYPGFENIELTIDISNTPKNLITIDYKRADKTATFIGEFDGSATAGSGSFTAKTPIAGYEDMKISGNFERVPGSAVSGSIDYSRADKYVKFEGSGEMKIERSSGTLEMLDLKSNMKLDTNVLKQVTSSMNIEINGVTTPNRSMKLKLEGSYNGQAASLIHSTSMVNHVLEEHTEIMTPFKPPYKRFTFDSKVKLIDQTATYSAKYGQKEISFDLTWFAGQARQYGFEMRAETPYSGFTSLELDVKGTVQGDGSFDLLAHYRRMDRMVHVTGTVKPYEIDLTVESPFGNFQVTAGYKYSTADKLYSVKGLVTLDSGHKIGGEITIKATSADDTQFTIDFQTPSDQWSRVTVDVAYTNTKDSHLIRVAFESPVTKRVEVALELTTRGSSDKTDYRAEVTTNYLGNAFTFRTLLLQENDNTKYELEVESPFHILPSFKITGRR